MRLEEYEAQQDWDNYSILVHALKSTAMLIGAVSLSKKAEETEQYSKEKNAYLVRKHHGKLMEMYRNTAEAISACLGGTETDPKEPEPDEILEFPAE